MRIKYLVTAILAFQGACLSNLRAQTSATWLGGSGNWTDGSQWDIAPNYPNNGQPDPADTYVATINGGTVTLDVDLTLNALLLNGGVLMGANAHSINAETAIRSFTFGGSGVKTLAGATSFGQAGSGSSWVYLQGGGTEVVNTGTFTQSAGFDGNGSGYYYTRVVFNSDYQGGSSVLRNAGTFISDTQPEASMGNEFYSNTGGAQNNRFVNEGTFIKSGSGRTEFNGVSFENSGSVQVQEGVLKLSSVRFGGSGTVVVSEEALLTFDGSNTFMEGTVIDGAGTVELIGGTQTLNGALEFNANVVLPNHIYFDGVGPAIFGGDALLTNGAYFSYLAATSEPGEHVVVQNKGVFTHQANGQHFSIFLNNYYGEENTIFENSENGVFVADVSNGGLAEFYENYTGSAFRNLGTFRKEGDGTHRFVNVLFDNAGVVEIVGGTEQIGEIAQRSGGTLTGGTWIVRDGAMLEMAGDDFTTNQADVTLDGNGARFDRILTVTDNQGALRLLSGRDFTAVGAFSNSGTLQLAGGEFGAPSLANSGTLAGFGSVAVRPANTGNVIASGGTLAFAHGIDGGGTLEIVPGAVLDLSAGVSGSAAGHLVHKGGILALGSNNLTIARDYTNENWGSGNTFNPRANVTGSGGIFAGGDTTLDVPDAIDFGNVHVGDVSTLNYRITNGGVAGADLRGAIQTSVNGGNLTDARLSGAGVTAGDFGALASGESTGDLGITFTAATAGALTGQAIHIATNFDNVADQTIPITGAAYRYASPTTTPTSINFGNVHVGDVLSQALSIGNDVPNDGFSESLNASFTATSGASTVSGSVHLLGAGGSSAAMSVGLNTTTAGAKAGTATIGYVSDGEGTSGLGLTTLGSQVVNVSGNVYRYAEPSVPEVVDFGIVHVGDVVSRTPAIANIAIADGFSEGLDVAVSGITGGFYASGSVENLAAGASSSGITVGFDTSTVGIRSGVLTLDLASNGGGTSGLGITTLPSSEVPTTAQVNYYAAPELVLVSGAASLTAISATEYVLDFGTINVTSGEQFAEFDIANVLLSSLYQDMLGGGFDTSGVTHFALTGFESFAGVQAGAAAGTFGVSFTPTSNAAYHDLLTIDLTSSNLSGTYGLSSITVTITAAAVPEPQEWGTILAGMLAVMAMLRRRAQPARR